MSSESSPRRRADVDHLAIAWSGRERANAPQPVAADGRSTSSLGAHQMRPALHLAIYFTLGAFLLAACAAVTVSFPVGDRLAAADGPAALDRVALHAAVPLLTGFPMVALGAVTARRPRFVPALTSLAGGVLFAATIILASQLRKRSPNKDTAVVLWLAWITVAPYRLGYLLTAQFATRRGSDV